MGITSFNRIRREQAEKASESKVLVDAPVDAPVEAPEEEVEKTDEEPKKKKAKGQ